MTKEELLCVLLMDEMAVQAKLEYCMTKQRWIGYATVPLSKKQQDDRTKKGKGAEKPLAHNAFSVMLTSLAGNFSIYIIN